MAIKVSFLLVVVAVIGSAVSQQDFDEADLQWPSEGISPLDSLAYWDTETVPDEEETAEAQGCCLPKTWTSTLFSEVKREGGRKQQGRSLRFAETVFVDENNQRIAQDVTVPRGPRRNASKISYIALFNKSNKTATLYAFSKKAAKCYTTVLQKAQFRSMCLPQNSTLLATYSLGAGARALRSQSWGFLVRDRRTTIVGSVVLTPENCVPILAAEKAFSRPRMTKDDEDIDRKRRPQVTTVGTLYTDFVTSIRDPSVFSPPSYCKREDNTLLFDEDIDFTTLIQRFISVPE